MKPYLIVISACCFFSILPLPIQYYTLLRIMVSVGAILAIYLLVKVKGYNWILLFIIILILFNPFSPIYLYKKSFWIPIDIAAGTFFFLLAFLGRNKNNIPENHINKSKKYTRDLIIKPKKLAKK